MSWRIAADLREMFAEVAVTDGHKTILGRTLNRKDQLLSGLTEALNLLPADIKSAETQVSIRSDFDRVTVREHWGAHTAFVCTEGFENLLEIGDQRRLSAFGFSPAKRAPLISREMCFGFTERTRADGTVEVDLDEKEIDFIITKLDMAEVKSVAVCFLHSNANAAHEKQLEKRLSAHGYEVVCSHHFKGNERERAERACTEAFLAQSRKKLEDDLVKLGFNAENIHILWAGPFAENRTENNNAAVCEFLEDRITMMGTPLKNISPLSRIILDEAGHVHFSTAPAEAEPGPISFGKGIQLCLLDLLLIQFKGAPRDLPRLKFDLGRPAKQLAPLAKQLRIDPETCLSKFIELAGAIIADEILTLSPGNPSRSLTAEGWLAALFAPLLSRHRANVPVKIDALAAWRRPLNMLKEHGAQVEIAFGDFIFEATK